MCLFEVDSLGRKIQISAKKTGASIWRLLSRRAKTFALSKTRQTSVRPFSFWFLSEFCAQRRIWSAEWAGRYTSNGPEIEASRVRTTHSSSSSQNFSLLTFRRYSQRAIFCPMSLSFSIAHDDFSLNSVPSFLETKRSRVTFSKTREIRSCEILARQSRDTQLLFQKYKIYMMLNIDIMIGSGKSVLQVRHPTRWSH